MDLEEDGDETEIHRTQAFVHKIGDSETTICFDEDGDLIDLDNDAEPLRRYKKKKMTYMQFKDCLENASKCG